MRPAKRVESKANSGTTAFGVQKSQETKQGSEGKEGGKTPTNSGKRTSFTCCNIL
uniref:Uncharacterized protein n=1 Tax=Rhizophora mucronata TaxID=61149 RepID=A0A2P2L723_RHIMU